MYESLNRHSDRFHLYIFAFDDISFEILKKLDLQNVTVIPLSEFETPELLEVKNERSKAEYCWTCTPSTISYVFDNYNVSLCTYLDSDLVFYSDPSVLIEEMIDHNKNVLITEHRFSYLPRLYEEKRAGRFCVQFVTFSNEQNSREILDKWRLQCINWCYARYEDGKFGDQKYLDNWQLNYPNIHVLQHQGGGIAPWNIQKYSFIKDENSIKGKVKQTGNSFNVIFFHFQYVKFLESGSYDIGWYLIPGSLKKLFYTPYLKKLEDIEHKLQKLFLNYLTGFTSYKFDSIKNILKTGFKKVIGYNIMKIEI
jgi:hypothetical protein